MMPLYHRSHSSPDCPVHITVFHVTKAVLIICIGQTLMARINALPCAPFPHPISLPGTTCSSRGRQGPNITLFLAAQGPYQEPTVCHDVGSMNTACSHCASLHWSLEQRSNSWSLEQRSNSSKENPAFGICCNSGKVIFVMNILLLQEQYDISGDHGNLGH
jgi:hypothetical protein